MCSKEKNRGLFEEAEWVGLKNEKKKRKMKKKYSCSRHCHILILYVKVVSY